MTFSFRKIKRLGEGYFGEVWLCREAGLDTDVAVKFIPLSKVIDKDNYFLEAQTLKLSEHPNVVKVCDTGQTNSANIYVSMEYLEKGSIDNYAKGAPLTILHARKVMIDVLRGLQHAHDNDIMHRDIKPANIMIGNSDEAKLGDFGLAIPYEIIDKIATVSQYQYYLHLAPEVREFTDYNFLSDVYSCGVTFYRLLNGDEMLPQVDLLEAREMAKKGEYPNREYYREYIPKAISRIANMAMAINPKERYQTPADMRRAIEKVSIAVDWKEVDKSTGKCWNAKLQSDKTLLCQLTKAKNGKYEILLQRGTEGHMRKVNKYCSNDLNERTAVKQCKKILQQICSGKIPIND